VTSLNDHAARLLHHDAFPLSNHYEPTWGLADEMGPIQVMRADQGRYVALIRTIARRKETQP
jgi:hypothetical protein